MIFSITPIDYQTGQKYLGNRFKERIEKNISIIRSSLQKEGYSVMDLSVSLDSDIFAWTYWPNEHLNEHGRAFLAETLAKQITSEP